MKNQSLLKILVLLIGLLSLFAAAAGLWIQTPGSPYPHTNHRGERVMINGRGLYFYDTTSMADQAQANDLITLFVGLPVLAISSWLAFRGSLRGRLLLTGTVGFLLYTYMSVTMLISFNELFLVYVALFGLCFYAFVLCMMSFDIKTLPDHFPAQLPRHWIAALLFVMAAFLTLLWLGVTLAPIMQNLIAALDNTTSFVIQAMDLVFIVPLAVLAAIQLLRRSAWGYPLASVFVMKVAVLGLAVAAMGINQILTGSADGLAMVVAFLIITVLNLAAAIVLLRNITERKLQWATSCWHSRRSCRPLLSRPADGCAVHLIRSASERPRNAWLLRKPKAMSASCSTMGVLW